MTTTRSREKRTRALGVVIPVNNEERLLRACLDALMHSMNHEALGSLFTHVVVVLDSCRDKSAFLAHQWKEHSSASTSFDVTIVDTNEENVGFARALGCEVLLEEMGEFDLDHVWLATTDADSRVPAEWLANQVRQHDLGADAWAGRVAVTEWPLHRLVIAASWQRAYDAEAHPIHGASFGVNARWYVDVGGFSPLRTSEDRALYEALVARGATVYYDATAPVNTSARRNARAPEGFSAALSRVKVRRVAI